MERVIGFEPTTLCLAIVEGAIASHQGPISNRIKRYDFSSDPTSNQPNKYCDRVILILIEGGHKMGHGRFVSVDPLRQAAPAPPKAVFACSAAVVAGAHPAAPSR
jgi:hypothetical protein